MTNRSLTACNMGLAAMLVDETNLQLLVRYQQQFRLDDFQFGF